MKSDHSLFTYQTRLILSQEQEAVLSAYADLYGEVERSLFADMMKGASPDKLKADYLQHFDITARQFNAIAINLKGKIASIKGRHPGFFAQGKARIKKAKKTVKDLEKKIKKAVSGTDKASLKQKLHCKKRRLTTLEARLARLEAEHKAGKVRLCFGGKKLFRAQFNLEANGYASHEEWLADWKEARSREFFVIGSTDETAGCQGCVAILKPDGSFTLRLRLPNAMGRWILIDYVLFGYGSEALTASLNAPTAISYRFLRDEKGWRVFFSTQLPVPARVSSRQRGAIGVDINADHLAVAELDRFGNRSNSFRLPCVTYGKTTHQAKALIGDAIKVIADLAVKTGKPVVVEDLDFAKNKAVLEQTSPAYARMLSSFTYSKVVATLKSACFKRGIELIKVNPAYTSTIGAVNHAKVHGISVHQGAATAIARRGLRLSERPTVRKAIVPTCHGGHVTFNLPVRNRSKHVWSFWSVTRKSLTAALAAHLRSGSPPGPLPLAVSSALGGTVQALSSTRRLSVRSRHANRHHCCSGGV